MSAGTPRSNEHQRPPNPSVMMPNSVSQNYAHQGPTSSSAASTAQGAPASANPALSRQQLGSSSSLGASGTSIDPDSQKLEHLTQALNLLNIMKDNMQLILDNVGKITSEDAEQAANQQSNEQTDQQDLIELTKKETDSKFLQEKALDLSNKLGLLENYINNIQPLQLNNNELFQQLHDQYNEKSINSVYHPHNIISNHRWFQKLQERLQIMPNANTQYKRYQTAYSERKSHKYKRYKPSNKNPDIEKSFIQFMKTNHDIKVVFTTINDKEITIDIIMPQNFKFIVYLFDYNIELVQVRGLSETRNETLFNDNFEDSERKNSSRVFERLEEISMYASIHYRSMSDNAITVLRNLSLWFKYYSQLFGTKCVYCERYLLNGFPPLWRDFRTYEAYHDECKP